MLSRGFGHPTLKQWMWQIIEVIKVFDGMGNSSEQLAHEIALMVGDPVYRQNWFDMLMWA